MRRDAISLILFVAIMQICLLVSPSCGEDYDEDLIPSDAPMTMMDRINTAKVISATDEVRLTTTMGTIIGLREHSAEPHRPNAYHSAFRGIPYAKPPVGTLRLADPVDLDGNWPSDPFNATRFRPFCLQYNVNSKTILGKEDCLYLNVYTPVIPGEGEEVKKSLPVFVFIPGGGYIRGSSSAHGAEKLLSRDLVVVTLNYRLGALGFLSTGDSVLPGNYGILDQASALRWVNRHISEFGGDPTRVTLGGFSAGASSANLHMYSPLTKDLFQRAILMSGAASCNFAVQEDPKTPAALVAAELSCPAAPSSAFLACVSSKDPADIIKAQAAILRVEFSPSWFAPIVDGGLRAKPFLPKPIEELEVQPYPVVVGNVPNEALLFAANAIVLSQDKKSTSDLYDTVVPESFVPWDDTHQVDLKQHLAESFYYSTHARTSKDTLLEEFVEALTDSVFVYCIWDTAAKMASLGSPSYMYLMTHRDPDSPNWASPLYQQLSDMGYTSPLLTKGVSHGDDLVHLFSFPYAMGHGSQRDKKVTDIIVSAITNFIIHGTPQTGTGFVNDLPEWTPVVAGQPVRYYDINANPAMVYQTYRPKERNFWLNTLPRAVSESKLKDVTVTATQEERGHAHEACPIKA